MLEVDEKRKRIALSMRLDEAVSPRVKTDASPPRGPAGRPAARMPAQKPAPAGGAMADALARALKRN